MTISSINKNLPPVLKDYQVIISKFNVFSKTTNIQVDILAAITDRSDKKHVLASLPTGKTPLSPYFVNSFPSPRFNVSIEIRFLKTTMSSSHNYFCFH